MKAIKAFFLSRLMREKALLLLFVMLGVAIWCSSFTNRAGTLAKEFRQTSVELTTQSMVLGQRVQIEEAAKKSIAQLDPSKTFNASGLFAAASGIAKNVGLSNTASDETNDETSSQFIVHNLRFRVRKAEFATIQKFYLEVQKKSPYIGLEQCTLQVDRAQPNQLTAVFKLTSVEVVRP
ncbi:MAG: hypothetical protein HZA31_01350 [Opitutae bacterium]|nr:hypothetical protein [Opitutae bacterium]